MSTLAKTEDLKIALRQVGQAEDALEGLAGIWPTTQSVRVWWDHHSKVFAADRGRQTCQALFGSHRIVRSLSAGGPLRSKLRRIASLVSPRRWDGPFSVEAPLPRDVVLIPSKPAGHGIVAASYHSGMVLKLAGGPGIAKEVEAWEIVKSAGIQQHAPMLMDHGVINGDHQWMLTQFTPNTDPLGRPLNPCVDPHRLWMHWLRSNVLPAMERFYEASGLEMIPVEELLGGITASLLREGRPEPLRKVVNLADDARTKSDRPKVLVTMIHRDLKPRHIHRHAGNWWILDWGSMGRGLTSTEVFTRYFGKVSEGEDHRAFWAWLRGDVSAEETTVGLRSEIDLYVSWYANWQKTTMTSESLRCQLLLAMLSDMHRVVTYFDLKDDLETRVRHADNPEKLPERVRDLGAQLKALGAC